MWLSEWLSRWACQNPPKKVGNYELGRTIGQGSFGIVRNATHVKTGDQVAIKYVKKGAMLQGDLSEEIRIHQLLDHENVVKMFEVVVTLHGTWIVMEHVSGGDLLENILENARLDEDDARRLFLQIIAGVEHCHNRNIAHRDIKPENLLLDVDLNIKIIDFGLAAEMAPGKLLKGSCGSPHYSAPELYVTDFEYEGTKVDVWACGVVLYAMLCGCLPFDASSVHQLYQLIKVGRYVVPGYVSGEAKQILKCMLCLKPVERITVSEIRQHAWLNADGEDEEALTNELRFFPIEAAASQMPVARLLPTLLGSQSIAKGNIGKRAASFRQLRQDSNRLDVRRKSV